MYFRRVFFVLTVLVVTMSSVAKNQAVEKRQSSHVFETTVKKNVKLGYLLYTPRQYDESARDWPLMLFLHGAGQSGDNLEKVADDGPPKLIKHKGKEFPFFVVSPQCPEGPWWGDEIMIIALNSLLDEVIESYRIDKSRLYITGLSMGGYGTWSYIDTYPKRFAAAAPICGGGDPSRVHRIKDLPIWVFHGGKDKVVPVKNSRDMVKALKKVGSDVKFTVYPETGHNSWVQAYADPNLYDWFLSKKR